MSQNFLMKQKIPFLVSRNQYFNNKSYKDECSNNNNILNIPAEL